MRERAFFNEGESIHLASMEPSTNVDGDRHHALDIGAVGVASMEPSTNVDGDPEGPAESRR